MSAHSISRVVFYPVSPDAGVGLLAAAQALHPDLTESDVLVTTDIVDMTRFVVRPTPGTELSGAGALVVFDTEANAHERADEVITRLETLGAQIRRAASFEAARTGADLTAWVSTGQWPDASAPAAEPAPDGDAVLSAILGTGDVPIPAPPPIPGDDAPAPTPTLTEEAPAPAPAVPEPAPAVPEPVPVVQPEAVVPAPAQPAAAPAQQASTADVWDDIVDSGAGGTPAASDTSWLEDVLPVADEVGVLGDAPASAPAPAQPAAAPAPPAPAVPEPVTPPAPQPQEAAFSLDDIAPMPPVAAPPVPEPSTVVPLDEVPPLRPERPAHSITEPTVALEEWASQAAVGQGASADTTGVDLSVFGDADRPTQVQPPVEVTEPAPAPPAPASPAVNVAGEREYAMKAGTASLAMPGGRKGISVHVTGSHGGSGKTTIAYLMPYVMGHVMKGFGKPVYLIEADYSNPKLAQRLGLRPDQNSGKFAAFVRELSSGAVASMTPEQVQERTRQVINEITYERDGMRIIACPYDTTARETEALRDAIQKLVNGLVTREECIVFIDGQTFAKDDALDATIASTADAVVLVGNHRHVEDAQAFRHMLTTPAASGGAGVSQQRISIFLNETSEERAKELAHDFLPSQVVGYLPHLEPIDDASDRRTTAWVGTELRDEDLTDAVTLIAGALRRFMPITDKEVQLVLSRLADRPLVSGAAGRKSAGGGRRRGVFGRRHK